MIEESDDGYGSAASSAGGSPAEENPHTSPLPNMSPGRSNSMEHIRQRCPVTREEVRDISKMSRWQSNQNKIL